MKRFMFVFMVVVFFATNVFAIDVDTRGLSETQKAELAMQAAKMKEEPSVAKSTPAKVNEWVDVGNNIGTAIISAAGKIGMAGDEFMKSNTGKVVVGLIVVKMIGGFIVHVVVGTFCLLLFLSIWTYLFRKLCIYDKITITPIEGMWFRKKEYVFQNDSRNSETRLFMWITFCFGSLICLAFIFSW